MILLDTNILVHATTRASSYYTKAKVLLDQVYEGKLEACVALQNLCEWYGVVTNPRRVTHPMSAEEAVRELETYLVPSPLKLLTHLPGVLKRLPTLLRRGKSRGPHIFDVLLVATMLEHGVHTIYTENTGDFSLFHEVRSVNPFA